MKTLFLVLSLIVITGCQQQEKPRQYTEVASQAAPAPQEQMADAVTKAPAAPANANPHAGLNMGGNLTPDARAALQKMMEQGQDPHAGIDMSQFGGKDPHAGLDMSAMMGGTGGPAAPSPLDWSLPKGWKQGPDKMMRLASFYIEKDPQAVDCSIVVLPGPAGGQEANLKRWMGQIGVDPSDPNYQKLVTSMQTITTKGGLEAKFFDFASLQPANAPRSMIASIISANGASIFVKMTGSRASVKQYQGDYLEFLKSLSSK